MNVKFDWHQKRKWRPGWKWINRNVKQSALKSFCAVAKTLESSVGRVSRLIGHLIGRFFGPLHGPQKEKIIFYVLIKRWSHESRRGDLAWIFPPASPPGGTWSGLIEFFFFSAASHAIISTKTLQERSVACGCDQSSHRNHLPSFLFVQVIFLLARRVPKEEGGARLGECQIKRRRAGHSLWVQRHGHSIVSWMQMRLLISLSHSFISSGCCFSTISSTSSTNKSNRYAYLTQMSMNQPTRVLGNCQLCHFSSIRTMSTGSADSTFWCHADPLPS